jgi:hypothetical protein
MSEVCGKLVCLDLPCIAADSRPYFSDVLDHVKRVLTMVMSPEQVVVMLRQGEVQLAQGKSLALACKEAGVSEQCPYRWRKEYGGLQLDEARRMKDLERESSRLRRLAADLSLEKQVLKDVASGNL